MVGRAAVGQDALYDSIPRAFAGKPFVFLDALTSDVSYSAVPLKFLVGSLNIIYTSWSYQKWFVNI